MNPERLLDAKSEVVSLTEVKNQLRIDVSAVADHDAFRLFIPAIRHKTENHLQKTLITSTWKYRLNCFPDEIQLPMAPIQSITSIDYIDDDGNPQVFTDFQFNKEGRLLPAYDFTWPSTREQLDAVTITYIAGYDNAGEVPEDVKLAMLLWIGECDIAREDVVVGAGVVVTKIPDGAANLLMPHRKFGIC